MDLSENIIRKNKIPVLIRDKTWRELFEPHKTRNMNKIAKEIEKLLAEERNTKIEFKKCQTTKKKLMESILYLSNELNHHHNESALEKLEKAKEEILKINEKIDGLQWKLEEILPNEIEKYNLDLLKETVEIAYKDIQEGSKKVSSLTEKITSLRQQLSDAWEEKIATEQRVEALYSYLHHTLGYEETNKLDKQFL